jgi:hypothetical protein
MRKGNGQPAKLSFGAQALMENRHGLLIDVRIGGAAAAEVAAAQSILDRRRHESARSFSTPVSDEQSRPMHPDARRRRCTS